MFAELKLIVDLVTTGVTDLCTLKSKGDRHKLVLRMLEAYFLLKDCLDEGAALVSEAGADPVATLKSMSADKAGATIERWDHILRKQGIRLNRLRDYFLSQDHLTVVAPDLQAQVVKAVGSKVSRVTTIFGIGASLFFYSKFPLAVTPDEKAQYVLVMAGTSRAVINMPKIKREIATLAESLRKYRTVIDRLLTNEEIVKLSKRARESTRFRERLDGESL